VISYDDQEFLHQCARSGPTSLDEARAHKLERLGLVSFEYEGRSLQGRWRLTEAGRIELDRINRAR